MSNLTMEAKPGLRRVLSSRDTPNHVMIQIRGGDRPSSEMRASLDLIAVVDMSSSMESGGKMKNVKKSLEFMVENMAETDRLTVIGYSSKARMVLPATRTTRAAKKDIVAAIGHLRPAGFTNFSGALGLACAQAKRVLTDTVSVRRIIFFTDGCPTTGNTELEFLVSLCGNAPEGWQVTTMGYGTAGGHHAGLAVEGSGMGGEVNLALLEEMARRGRGNFYYMRDEDTAARAFATELGGLISTVAQNIEVEIRPVTARAELGRVLESLDVEQRDEGVIVRMPDVLANETKFVTFEVKCRQQDHPGAEEDVQMARVTAKFLDAVTGRLESLEVSANVMYVAPGREDSVIDPDVATQLALLQAVNAQEKAHRMALAKDFGRASQLLSDAADNLRDLQTARSMILAEGFQDMSEIVFDKDTFDDAADTYAASAYEARYGRSAGGSFSDSLLTPTQENSVTIALGTEDLDLLLPGIPQDSEPETPRKTVVDAKAALDDIRAGMDEEALKAKYKLSHKGLQSLLNKLEKRGLLGGGSAGRRIPVEEALADVLSDMDNATLMKKYRVSVRGLRSLLGKLVDAGLLSAAEMETRLAPGAVGTPREAEE
ncbi:MAG: VWA domain-containing protein [Thermodesulfobacteriota bacterium]